jgi:hypothetical protein
MLRSMAGAPACILLLGLVLGYILALLQHSACAAQPPAALAPHRADVVDREGTLPAALSPPPPPPPPPPPLPPPSAAAAAPPSAAPWARCALAESMEAAGIATGTDKVLHHGYFRWYQHHLNALCAAAAGGEAQPALLEIGINTGRSLGVWRAALPGWYVYGMDRGVELQQADLTVVKADQSKFSDIQRVAALIRGSQRPVLLINDDGSHVPEHQLLTFNLLFAALLQPGGVYIIEDIETSYWTGGTIYGYRTPFGLYNNRSAVELLKAAADAVNAEFLLPSQLERLARATGGCLESEAEQTARIARSGGDYCHGLWPETLRGITSVQFAHNAILVTKRGAADARFERSSSQYDWAKMLDMPPLSLTPNGRRS